MKKNYALSITCGTLCFALLAGCASAPAVQNTPNIQDSTTNQSSETGSAIADVTPLVFPDTANYADWKAQSYTTINLEDGSQTITKSGVYELTGVLSDGTVTVNIDKTADTGTVQLVLNNAEINSTSGTPINIIEAEKAVLILENGTVNTVTQGEITTTDTEFPTAAVFSKADFEITGSGTLNVTTKYNDGITSKDDLIITGGIINVNATSDGIVGKDILAVEQGVITITAGKDGLRATNTTDVDRGNVIIAGGTFSIDAANDGITAEKVLQIDGGEFDIKSGGGYTGSINQSDTFQKMERGSAQTAQTNQSTEVTESKKAVKSGTGSIINAGTFTISAYEDAVHSNGNVTINGGTFTIQSGDDAIHSDGAVQVNGGTIDIKNSYEGIEGANVTVKDGKIDIISDDDGINVNTTSGVLAVDGGEITVTASGDGVDSNGNITQSGGKLTIDTAAVGAGNTSIDYDGTFSSTGGTIIDQNGNAIDTSAKQGMGGGGIGGGKPARPKN